MFIGERVTVVVVVVEPGGGEIQMILGALPVLEPAAAAVVFAAVVELVDEYGLKADLDSCR